MTIFRRWRWRESILLPHRMPAPDAAPGTLQVQVRTEQPVVVVGSVDDADVRRVLTYVVANGERFDPGVRLDCLDALKARSDDEQVRRALVVAARKDHTARGGFE